MSGTMIVHMLLHARAAQLWVLLLADYTDTIEVPVGHVQLHECPLPGRHLLTADLCGAALQRKGHSTIVQPKVACSSWLVSPLCFSG